VIMAEGSFITLDDLDLKPAEPEPLPFNLKQIRDEAEGKAIQRALTHCNNNISDAASLLGVTRPTLYNLLEKFDLKP